MVNSGLWRGAEAFVAEVAVDLEHLLEAADHQALQVQLGRDAQEQFHVQRVVVGGEGLGRGAAGDGMHHRRFDLEEAVVHHVIADRLDHAAAGDEGEARLLVGDQVEVALRYFCSTSVRPWNFSGSGRSDLVSRRMLLH
jgi:hypothetical protein